MIPPHRRSTFGRRAFSVTGPMEWNSLPRSLRDPARSTDGLKSALKTHLLRRKGTFSALEARRDALYKSTTTNTTTTTHQITDLTQPNPYPTEPTHISNNNWPAIRITHRTASFHKTNLPVDTRYKVTYILYHLNFCRSAISDPRPNLTHSKQKFRTHYRPNPTQPAGQPNPRTTLLFAVECMRENSFRVEPRKHSPDR